jgi:hypothetical protein
VVFLLWLLREYRQKNKESEGEQERK